MPNNVRHRSQTKRSCLMCGKMFGSNGIHNRRCPRCKRIETLRGIGIEYRYKVSREYNDVFAGM